MELTNKDDVVVGCITNYDFNAIAPWVNSLDRSGFKGSKVVICYNIKADVLKELTERGYTVFAFGQDEEGNAVYNRQFSIVVERFFHIWAMLHKLKGKHRYLIHTDVKDVIFQDDPSWHLHAILTSLKSSGKKILASSESIRYRDEDWGRQNLIDSYGQMIYETHKDNVIVNAGTLSGDFDTLVDFFLNVYMVSVGGKTHNPDQAAVNILLSQSPYREITRIATSEDVWSVQAGTTHDPNKTHYLDKLVDPEAAKAYLSPEENSDWGLVTGSGFRNGHVFPLVHQYDRVPQWRDALLRKYGK